MARRTFQHRSPVDRCSVISETGRPMESSEIRVTVFHPFPDIPGGIVNAKGVRLERTHGSSLFSVPRASAFLAIGVSRSRFVAPPKPGFAPGPGDILPFRLAEQPVVPAGLSFQPPDIGLRIAPRHVDHRLPVSSPAFITRPVLGTTAILDAGFPLPESDLEFTDGEWLRDRDGVDNAFLRPLV